MIGGIAGFAGLIGNACLQVVFVSKWTRRPRYNYMVLILRSLIFNFCGSQNCELNIYNVFFCFFCFVCERSNIGRCGDVARGLEACTNSLLSINFQVTTLGWSHFFFLFFFLHDESKKSRDNVAGPYIPQEGLTAKRGDFAHTTERVQTDSMHLHTFARFVHAEKVFFFFFFRYTLVSWRKRNASPTAVEQYDCRASCIPQP